MNASGLLGDWFWWVGIVVRRFNSLEASPKGSSVERFPMFIGNTHNNDSVYLLMIKRFMKSLFHSNLSTKIYELANIPF